jgi:hypothetical protein
MVVPERGVSDGFDLDGLAGPSSGCPRPDLVDASGRQAVDNQVGTIWEAHREAFGAVMESLLDESASRGDTTRLLYESSDGLRLAYARPGTAMVNASGRLRPGQTFEPDPERPDQRVGAVPVGPGVAAGPVTVDARVPMFGAAWRMRVHQYRVRLEPMGDGVWHGWVGGWVDLADVALGLGAGDPVSGPYAREWSDLVAAADMDGSGAAPCDGVSFALAVEAVDAFVAE